MADEDERISAAIAGLEAQRAILGDAVVDPAVAALRKQLAPAEAAAGESSDERKLVTVLFCDISGFTALAEKQDPEAVRELVNACFDCLVPVVQKYEGTVDKFIGDEIMALFGAPLAHEDDAERALRAALEMQEALTDFNRGRGTSLGLHFGINTGPVVAGNIGGRNRLDYSVMGDAVNLAARLEEASTGGEIFVGPTTYRLTNRLFQYEVVAPLVLKGKEAPVEVHRLVGLKSAPKSSRGIEGLRASLVGREAELAILRRAISALERGEGSVLAIIGEAGLGKSRLVEEARAFLPETVRWAEGRALSYDSGLSYGLARKVMLSLLGLSPGDSSAATAEALRRSLAALRQDDQFPYLARMLALPLQSADEERVKFLPGEALQARILEAVQGCVRESAARQPLILFWEDLHWCDPSSRQVFRTLHPLAREVPLLILSASRPEEIATDSDDGDSTRVRLAPLTRAQSGSLIGQLLQIENLPERTRDLILSRAEGNPFFLEELLRALIDAGAVVLDDGRVVATNEINSIEIPETVQGVLAARIDRLPAASKRVLQRASVIGRIFQERVLAHLFEERKRPRLAPALDELEARDLVRPHLPAGSAGAAVESREYIFQHAITHEVAYESMLLARRRELHRRAGETIEQLFPERVVELAGTIGFHFDRAGSSERAAFHLRRAGDAARANFANAEAVTYYQSAIRHTGQLLEGENQASHQAGLLQLNECLGDVLTLTGERDEACAAFERALRQCTGDDAISRSRLHRKLGFSHSLQRNFAATAHSFGLAEAELGTETADAGAAWWEEKLQIQLERMHLFYWQEMVPEMRVLADTFAADIGKHGTPMQRSKFLKMLALSLLMGSHFRPSRECLELGKRAVAASASVTDLSDKAHTVFVLGLIELWHGAFAESIARSTAALELANRVGDQVMKARCLNYLALAHRRRNEVSAARTNAEETLALASKLRMVEYIAMAKANLAWVAWKEDRLQTVDVLGAEALSLWHGMEDPLIFDWIALWPLIAAATDEGDLAKAIDRMRGLFAEGQYPLAEQVTADCRSAMDCATRQNPEALRQSLEQALGSARSFHYL